MNTFSGVFCFLFLAAALYQIISGHPWPTKRVWHVANILMVLLTPWEGYVSMAPEKLRHANPDAIFCALILLITPLFAIGSVYYSIHRWHHDMLPRPSWNRNPLNWWHDPLQSLFITTCCSTGIAIGSLLRLPAVGSVAFWTLGMYICIAIGLFVGQLLAYRIYREHIAAGVF